MASNDKVFMGGNPIFGGHSNEAQYTTPANAQDQTLLKALQDLVVRAMEPKQMNAMNQIHLGPEGGKLITALQDFISSIVIRSQSEAQNTIVDVSLDEEDNSLLRVQSDLGDEGGGSSLPILSYGSEKSNAKTVLIENKLRELRKHVFNEMPIRLLCFEPRGSSFRIVLSERGAIYERLASRLKEDIYEATSRSYDDLSRTLDDIERRPISQYTAYAILSHTWLRSSSGEVTYGYWKKGIFNAADPGYRKLVNFCKAAWKDHHVAFGWMDTVCINKESSSELDESIRSMYNWYKRAAVCINYLAETETLADMHLDPWFTRGWTLQELVAPQFFKFYNRHWKWLAESLDNDKKDVEITSQIERATTISRDELQYIHMAPISRRMQLAATREVTREEDMAYSLMGIFNVSISTAYGEGSPRAFLRLLQEIMASSSDALDILNWAGEIPFAHRDSNTSAILPYSPKYYIQRSSNRHLILRRPVKPLTLSHLGLHVPVILMPGRSNPDATPQYDPIGDYNSTVDISPVGYYGKIEIPTTYNILDNRVSGEDGWKVNRTRYQMTFAVFNFTGARNIISLPKTCIALGLECDEPAGEVSNSDRFDIIRTMEPIVFKLSKTNANPRDLDDRNYWKIPTGELTKHGMELISLYL